MKCDHTTYLLGSQYVSCEVQVLRLVLVLMYTAVLSSLHPGAPLKTRIYV